MKMKQLLAVLLCFALLLCCAPVVFAAEDTVTVTFWYANGSEIRTLIDLTVSDGTAESYGYTVAAADHSDQPITTVTVMDVLAAAHAAIYGDAFSADTANDYLTISNSFLLKAFGIETYNLGIVINGVMPHDDVYTPTASGGYYTGYAADTARVRDGDNICLFMYKDTNGWSDILPRFPANGIEATAGEAFTLSLGGYAVMNFGCEKQETIDRNTKPLKGVKVECTQDFETFTELGTLDGEGKLSVTMPETGTQYLVVRGSYKGEGAKEEPVIATICKVVVKQAAPDTSNAKYIPVSVRPLVRFADYTLTLGLVVKFRDLRKSAPDKTETYAFSISLRFLAKLFNK